MKLLKNIFLFLFVTILLSCSNVFENSNETDFIVSLDLSELVNNQNKTQARNASENVGKLTLTLYNALDNSIEQAKEAISKEVLPVVSSVAVDINTEGTTKVSFLKIPIGINAVIFAECSIPNADNSNVLYEGYSQVFEVTSGKNSVKIDLSKIVTEANPEDNVTEDNEKTDEDKTDEEGEQVTEDTKDPEPTPEPEPEEVVVEPFTLKKQSATGQELVLAENEKVEKETGYTRIITNKDDSNNVWTYFVSPENNEKFKTDGNYFVSVDLWSSEDTVVAVAASRADMFFTVDGNSDGEDKWTHCEFETGFVKAGINNSGLTFGVGLSSEIRIKNLKVERISDTSNLPTLSFYISDEGIKNYLAEENKADQIIFVEKSEDKAINGYKINLNAKGVTLKLRNYATPGKINNASFNLIADGSFSFLPSIKGYSVKPDLNETDNKNEDKINYWANPSTVKENNNVCFPAFKNSSEDTIVPCVIDGLFNEGTESTGSITITDFEIKPVDNLENTDKTFAIRVGQEWSKLFDLSTPIEISSLTNGTELQVVLTDNNWNSWDDKWQANEYYCQFKVYNKADNSNLNVSALNGDSCIVSGAEKIKLSLTDDFTVLIEEVTGTNNDQPPSGGAGGGENQGEETGLLFEQNAGETEGRLLIYNVEGLKKYRSIVNGESVNVPVKGENREQQVSYQLPAYLEDDIEIDGEWTPIGSLDHALQRDFDGQGHSITFTESSSFTGDCVGVFGYAGNYNEPNTISNLAVKGVLSSANAKYVGGIVAYGIGINVKNCINMASLCSGTYVGGIIGYVYANGDNTTNSVSKCINAGEISWASDSSHYRGGIVAHTAGDITISDCINLVELSSNGTGKGSGIVDVEDTHYKPTASVKNCINVGFVNFHVNIAIANETDTTTIENCYYDSDKWTRVGFGTYTPTDTSSIAKTTTVLCTLKSENLFTDWSFAADGTRYPLPDLSGVFESPSGEESIWDQICVAAQIQDSASATVKPSDF